MAISKETQEKINFLFKTNPEMIEKLYRCDADAIREIGSLSQKGINPDDVIVAYESGNPNNIEYLYQRAKRLVGLQYCTKSCVLNIIRKQKRVQKM